MAKKVKKNRLKSKKKEKSIKVIETSEKIIEEKSKPEKLKEKESGKIREEQIPEFQEEHRVNLEESLIHVKAPVLERVAIAEDQIDLEKELAAVQSSKSTEREQNQVNYTASSGTDYLTTHPEQREENNFRYAGTQTDYSAMAPEDKEREETRRWVAGGINPNERNREIGRIPEIEGDKETRKYLSKGDQK